MPVPQAVLRCLMARIYLLHYGDALRARALLKPFESAERRASCEPMLRAEISLWLGWTYACTHQDTYDDARALTLLNDALRLYVDRSNTEGRCWALLGKAYAYTTIDEYALMRRTLQEASILKDQIQDAQMALWTLDLGIEATQSEGRFAETLQKVEALLEQATHLSDSFAQGRALAYQSRLFIILGRAPDLVIKIATEALKCFSPIRIKAGAWLVVLYKALIHAHVRQGRWQQAEQVIDDALQETETVLFSAASLLLTRVTIDLRRGHFADAEELLHTISARLNKRQQGLLGAAYLLGRYNVLLSKGQGNQAESWAEKAYHVSGETGHTGAILNVLLNHVEGSLMQGKMDEARTLFRKSQSFSPHFSTLPTAARRFYLLGHLACAEQNDQDAQILFTQALSAFSMSGDAYWTAKTQAALAAQSHLLPTDQIEDLLDSAHQTFQRLGIQQEVATSPTLGRDWIDPTHEIILAEEPNIGASLARASLSVTLVCDTWLNAAKALLPGRWLGLYKCPENEPWTCVRELGPPPAIPAPHEPCKAQIQEENVLWIRLRSHPGPAFFFGVALGTDPDSEWESAHTRMKPWIPVANLALDHALLREKEVSWNPKDTDETPLDVQEGFIFANPSLQDLVRRVRRIRASHSPVLISGEQGCGKKQLARLIHAESERRGRPFVTYNAAQVTDHAQEKDLFGEKGFLQNAKGGTLLIEHIEQLSREAQQHLTQFLVTSTDIRLFATTTSAPNDLVQKCGLLEDLYFHLNAITFNLPPLRERRDEIPLLVRHFTSLLRPPGTPLTTLTKPAIEALLQYDWPGNVRQLRNEIERALLLASSEPIPMIDKKDLSPAILAIAGEQVSDALLEEAQQAILQPAHSLDDVLAHTEKSLIEKVLEQHQGQVSASAETLGLTRQGLYKKIKRLGIDTSQFHHNEYVRAPKPSLN